MTVIVDAGGKLVAYNKGAPEVMIDRCTAVMERGNSRPMTPSDRDAVYESLRRFANQGLRTLALTKRTVSHDATDVETAERDLTLLGIVGMLDPPRRQVAQAVAKCKTAGIRLAMITGDSVDTAKAIAGQVGIDATKAINGQSLDEMDDEELWSTLQRDVVFARTTPEHKLRIVNVLQDHGEVAAMTGDGVNDAPALKQADVGIAMGNRGTDVAKNAADIVLTDDNFSAIVGAVEEGRRQYDNIQKFVRYLLSSNVGEIIAIAGNIMLGGPLILLPVQILWMNLVTDGITAVALGLEPAERTVMQRPPRNPNSRILDLAGLAWITTLGLYMGGICLFVFHWYRHSTGISLIHAQTVAFTALIVVEKANVLNFRSLRDSIYSLNPRTNLWIYIAMVSMVLLQIAAVHVPLLQAWLHTCPMNLQDWGLVFALAIPVLAIGELLKFGQKPWSNI
jgi:Ca2+-transporting ATPase